MKKPTEIAVRNSSEVRRALGQIADISASPQEVPEHVVKTSWLLIRLHDGLRDLYLMRACLPFEMETAFITAQVQQHFCTSRSL